MLVYTSHCTYVKPHFTLNRASLSNAAFPIILQGYFFMSVVASLVSSRSIFLFSLSSVYGVGLPIYLPSLVLHCHPLSPATSTGA